MPDIIDLRPGDFVKILAPHIHEGKRGYLVRLTTDESGWSVELEPKRSTGLHTVAHASVAEIQFLYRPGKD